MTWSAILRRAEQEDVQVGGLRATLTEGGISLLAFTEDDATAAAALRRATHQRGLSLADRACLALAGRLGVPAVTADRAWLDSTSASASSAFAEPDRESGVRCLDRRAR